MYLANMPPRDSRESAYTDIQRLDALVSLGLVVKTTGDQRFVVGSSSLGGQKLQWSLLSHEQ